MSGTTDPPAEVGAPPPPSTLALVGAKWVGLGALLQRALQMGAVILLARLLVPEDFGVFAVVSVAIDALNTFKDFGHADGADPAAQRSHQAATTLFYLSVASAGIICCVTWIAAPQLAAFVGSPLVTPVLRAMAFKTLFESASIVQRTLAVRELSVGRVTTAGPHGGRGRVLRWRSFWPSQDSESGRSFWGSLVASALSAVVWWNLSTWRPAGPVSASVARHLITFGASVSVSWAIENAIDAVTRALVGRWQGVVGLGYHDLAVRLTVIPIRSVTLAVGQYVAIPAMCLVQRDLQRMASWYLSADARARGHHGAAGGVSRRAARPARDRDLRQPVGCRGPARPAPGAHGFLLPLLYTRPVYVATGRVDLLLRVSLLQLILTTPAAYLAARVSLEAVCAVQVGVFGVVAAVNITFIRRLLNLGWSEIARALRAPLEGVAVQALVLLGLRAWLRPEPTVWAFGAMATPALVAYAVVMRLRQPELVAVPARRREAGLRPAGGGLSVAPRLVITNVYGAHNRGDAAIVLGMLRSLRARPAFRDAEIVVSSSDPEFDCTQYSVPVIPSLRSLCTRISRGPVLPELLFALVVLPACLAWALAHRVAGVDLWLPAVLRHVLRAYRDADLVVAAGGGYLYTTSPAKGNGVLLATVLGFLLGASWAGRSCSTRNRSDHSRVGCRLGSYGRHSAPFS